MTFVRRFHVRFGINKRGRALPFTFSVDLPLRPPGRPDASSRRLRLVRPAKSGPAAGGVRGRLNSKRVLAATGDKSRAVSMGIL